MVHVTRDTLHTRDNLLVVVVWVVLLVLVLVWVVLLVLLMLVVVWVVVLMLLMLLVMMLVGKRLKIGEEI
ncbi:hypothetical protein Pmani_031397 [Petrolisthes manimaculis]|uniref:Uncharacterized protein n=1 Tax=Petrolisthes manimaculis TaxID=1843537 RepID=A0AAE1NVZ6_9EUCA|nr:hypothetical protein Pmani_031397 [Petrolisthes manimaculis]